MNIKRHNVSDVIREGGKEKEGINLGFEGIKMNLGFCTREISLPLRKSPCFHKKGFKLIHHSLKIINYKLWPYIEAPTKKTSPS